MYLFIFINFCPHLTGLPDPQRLECNVQHPGHPWDRSGLPEPGAVWPRSVRSRPGGESVGSVQLRAVRWRRAKLRRKRTGTNHPKDSDCGADRDLQMDFGHWELSQDADGADSAPGKRAACAFHVQLPALDTNTDWQTEETHPRGNLTFNLLLEKLSMPKKGDTTTLLGLMVQFRPPFVSTDTKKGFTLLVWSTSSSLQWFGPNLRNHFLLSQVHL